MVTKKKFKIEGMHCVSCCLSIDGDLEDMEGVKSSTTNFAKQESIVEYDENTTSPQKIVEVIKSTGYNAMIDAS